jgi:hypothetical protein
MKKWFNQLSLSHGSQGRQFMLDGTLKDVTFAILIVDEQRVIIKFLFKEGADARQIAERLRAQFHEDAYALRSKFGLQNRAEVEKTFTTNPGREELPQKILQPKSKNHSVKIYLNWRCRRLRFSRSRIRQRSNMTFFTPISFLGRVERFSSAPTHIADFGFSE